MNISPQLNLSGSTQLFLCVPQGPPALLNKTVFNDSAKADVFILEIKEIEGVVMLQRSRRRKYSYLDRKLLD